jgi:hypothetical protein
MSRLNFLKYLPLSVLISTPMIHAAEFPRGCTASGYAFIDEYLVVNDQGNQTLFMMQNRVDKMVELQKYETKDVFMSPPLKGKMSPLLWGAFASDEKNTYFKCIIREGDQTAGVKCSEVLEVCQYPRVKFALSNMGNYWVSYNKPQAEIINDAIAKGIYLRW